MVGKRWLIFYYIGWNIEDGLLILFYFFRLINWMGFLGIRYMRKIILCLTGTRHTVGQSVVPTTIFFSFYFKKKQNFIFVPRNFCPRYQIFKTKNNFLHTLSVSHFIYCLPWLKIGLMFSKMNYFCPSKNGDSLGGRFFKFDKILFYEDKKFVKIKIE